MTRLLVLALFLASMAPSARAALSRSAIADVSVSLPQRAHIDLSLAAPDAAGRTTTLGDALAGHPGFVTFVDYTCTSLCGSDLRLIAAAIESAGLDASRYRLLVIGIDPKDTPGAAVKLAANEIPTGVREATALLLPSAPVVARIARSLGFFYVYDATLDQFAHPAALYSVSAEGGVTALMSPFALEPEALRLSLERPAPLAPPTIGERIRILCYAFDAVTGLYTGPIVILLKAAAAISLATLAGGIAFAIRKSAR